MTSKDVFMVSPFSTRRVVRRPSPREFQSQPRPGCRRAVLASRKVLLAKRGTDLLAAALQGGKRAG